jgi:23S rRNA (cytosine1962-C5)-methyltransferase
VGRGLYNPRPALCCRILTREDEPLDADFFRGRLAAALSRRSAGELGRLVWSEGDRLPGLVVDRYGPVLVVQCMTLGMTRVRADVIATLRDLIGPLPVYVRDDDVAARLEGFEPLRGWWRDETGPDSVVVREGTVQFRVTFGHGHKTGLYLDQAENRRRVASYAHRRSMLDAFAYTAGFACHALAAGATAAVCIESSPDGLAGARANLTLNGVADRAELIAGNVFDELRRLEREHRRFGLVVLDPPPFARTRDAVEAAARGYKEINLRALRLLEPAGVLATFSCSYHVPDELFVEICRDAAIDAGTDVTVLGTLTQASDHPALLAVPETRYLKGLLLSLT